MCAIFGALVWNLHAEAKRTLANTILDHIFVKSHERGRDGRGCVTLMSGFSHTMGFKDIRRSDKKPDDIHNAFFPYSVSSAVCIGNLRAEPTTEFIRQKTSNDQQPYTLKRWSIVHNGTIANDKFLRQSPGYPSKIDSAAIVETLVVNDSKHPNDTFQDTVTALKGSFAILAIREEHVDTVFVATNYRPIWYIKTAVGFFFASSRSYFPDGYSPQMVEPYSVGSFSHAGGYPIVTLRPLIKAQGPRRALVVCSGGLDSVVAATYAQRALGYEITLLHFTYGSRAQEPEVNAVTNVANQLGVPYILRSMDIYHQSDSPLLDPDSNVAGGEEGAEFAHEWVPARNLVMLSLAVAIAEADGYDTIILGNNLEEAGAYPDNEPEFIHRFNDMLSFAVADGKRIRVEMPVGNLMKHEIVALGLQHNAPLHLTWSCYRAGPKHCGTCGPCYMRRTAFEINYADEVIEYVSSDKDVRA